MKIIEPSAELMTPFNGKEVLKFIEQCGRVCYRSEKNITADSAEKFIRARIKSGHESILEHFSCTFKIICDRGVMAELTRHRLASFSVESTRYCDYSKDDLTFIKPCYWEEPRMIESDLPSKPAVDVNQKSLECWRDLMYDIENIYRAMRIGGNVPPEQARAILPNSLATTIIMTANLREWRHILKLRTASAAHPQMRKVANMILDILKNKLPVVFEDVGA